MTRFTGNIKIGNISFHMLYASTVYTHNAFPNYYTKSETRDNQKNKTIYSGFINYQ